LAPPPVHDLLLIRHAPALHEGRLAGRRDVSADVEDGAAIARLRAMLGPVDAVVSSPALRCRQTAGALFPDTAPTLDPRLWEQDFGAWEGLPFADMPDLGAMRPADLAAHRPPGGESFADVCTRVAPALKDIARREGRTAIIAHAGTVRAGLAMALGHIPAALAFSIAPLSVTRLMPCGDSWAIDYVNRTTP
jgi:alpha-ribazole phosphatase